MDVNLEDTIVALGSGIAAGRRSIVRISGKQTHDVLARVLLHANLDQRRASSFEAKVSYAALDRESLSGFAEQLQLEVACYFWPDARSFTGEPCAEIHLLGSLPLVEMLIEQILRAGARPADRGEFTLRSFLAQKLDLTQAEAVLGVIEAQDETQLHRALEQLAGNLSEPVKALRIQLIELVGHLEAGLDFVEEDIEFISAASLVLQLKAIREQLLQISRQLESRGSRSKLPSVVLVGPPNAGKSTLFNKLLGEDRAIVSKQAGTTRDAVSATLQLGEQSLDLVDTAGIEELAEQTPRALAQSVLQTRLQSADLILFCNSDTRDISKSWLDAHLKALPKEKPRLLVGTKSDQDAWDLADIRVSQHDGESISSLCELIFQRLAEMSNSMSTDGMHHALLRSRAAIDSACIDLERAIQNAETEIGEELVAAELRFALEHLGQMIGEVHSEDILSNIFSRFCIGK